MPAAAQTFLCGLLNSYVANYLVRQRVTTHVGAAVIRRIPAPRPDSAGPVFREGVGLAAALTSAADPEHDPAYARLQALVARAYRLTEPEFSLILGSFPLVEDRVLAAAREAFRRFSL
jgi:hypothetical protein